MADKRKRRKLASGHEVINDGEDFNDDRQNEKKTRSKIIDLKNLDIHESDEDNEDDDDFDDVGNNIGYRKRRENYEPQENSADDENGSDDEDGDDIDNLDAIGEGNEDDEEDKNDDAPETAASKAIQSFITGSTGVKFSELQLLITSIPAGGKMPHNAGDIPRAVNHAQRVADFDEIMEMTQSNKKKKKAKLKRHQIPRALMFIMGAANNAYAEQKWDMAIKLCNDVIMQAPFVPDPYTLMALIYEEKGEQEKALQYRKLESVCLPKTAVNWVGLARTSWKFNELTESRNFYDEAIRQDKTNPVLYYERAVLQIRLGNIRRALIDFQQTLSLDPFNLLVWNEFILSANALKKTTSVSRTFISTCASELMQRVLENVHNVTESHVLLAVKFLTKQQFPADAMKVARAYLNVSSEVEVVTDASGWEIPENVHPGLRLYLGLCHLQMPNTQDKASHILDPFVKGSMKLFKEDKEMCEDVVAQYIQLKNFTSALDWIELICAMDITMDVSLQLKKINCFMGLDKYAEAQAVAIKVLEVHEDNQDAIWTMYTCYNELNDADRAATWRQKLNGLTLARKTQESFPPPPPPPRTKRPRQSSKKGKTGICKQGKYILTFVMFSTDVPEGIAADLEQEFQRFSRAQDLRDIDELLVTGVKLCSHFLYNAKKTNNCRYQLIDASKVEKLSSKKNSATVYGRLPDGTPQIFDHKVLNDEQWIFVIVRTCEALLERNRAEDAVGIAHRAAQSESIHACHLCGDNKTAQACVHTKSLFGWLEVVGYKNLGDYEEAFRLVKLQCTQLPSSFRLWNKFYDLFFSSKYHIYRCPQNIVRFMLRIIQREKRLILPVLIVLGNHHLMNGSYSWAAGCYTLALESVPDNPMLNLLLGAAYLRTIMQRRVVNRHLATAQAFCSMGKYFDLMGGKESIEACYNMGRAYHHIGLSHLALPYYEAVLEFSDEEDESGKEFKPLAAYNLSIIYAASGSLELAKYIRDTHCSL
eukprot:m.55970 g.55970  ORF g.55970 m.55970 type:complete len:988 (+) comp11013_c0_seq2:89-3052(+)